MESILIEVAKSSPSAILSLVMVYIFLNFIKEQNSVLREVKADCHEFQERIHAKQEALSTKIVLSIDRNSECLTKCEEAHKAFKDNILSSGKRHDNA